MFGSSFSLGFTLQNVVTQIAGLLGNPLIAGLVLAGIAIMFSRYLIRFALMVGRGGGDYDPSNHQIILGQRQARMWLCKNRFIVMRVGNIRSAQASTFTWIVLFDLGFKPGESWA